jgi:hypothetical protein
MEFDNRSQTKDAMAGSNNETAATGTPDKLVAQVDTHPTGSDAYKTGIVVEFLDMTDPRVSAAIDAADVVGFDLQTGQYRGDIVSHLVDVVPHTQPSTTSNRLRCIL